jgi:nucleotidyltransferase substrate binding protein (TIGR01987 family)
MDRLTQRLHDSQRALTALQSALDVLSPSELERDGAIQRFEFTYEAVWKFAQAYLETHEGIQVPSPRAVFRGLGKVGVLLDGETLLALEMSDDRNRTVHTYIEAVARQIFEKLPDYAPLLHAIAARIQDRLKTSP